MPLIGDSLYKERTIVKETEWTRVYSVGPNELFYESKFVKDNLQVSAEDIVQRWSTFTPDQQLDFVTAFQSKQPLTTEDEHILEFLMEHSDETIGLMIALPLTELIAKRDKVLAFLLSRVKQGRGLRANYYQALAVLDDRTAVPALRSAYEEGSSRMNVNELLQSFEDLFLYLDYLECCVALYSLTGAAEYIADVKKLSEHPDERVRARVKRATTQMDRKPEIG